MSGGMSFHRASSVLTAELASIRRRDPSTVDGMARSEAIAQLVPSTARWWVAFGPLPVIAAIWAYQARRLGGFTQLRMFLADDPSK